MASFLAGPAAELVGMGMQAVGVGIPVNSSAAKLIDGVRGLGLPVPPKSWFKNKSKSRRDYEEEKKTVYDKLESHVNGVIQVVKPVIELKQMVREGCCRSADRDSRRRDRSQSPRNELTYYTPQKCTSGSCMFSPTSRDSVSPKKNSKKACKNGECNSGGGSRRWKSRNDSSSDEEASCMYCSRSRSLIQLPCGRMICSKCDKTENHDLELNMPRRTNSEQKFSLREPEDIIDLTQDSPSNVALRRSRSHVNHDVQVAAIDTEDVEPVHIEDANPNNRSQSRTQRNNQPTVVINLEDTINLDDTPCCINEANQVSVLPVSSPSYKRGLSCPICLENLADENIKPMTTPCGHVYCLDCLKTITRAKKKCSLCQRPITFSKCIRLHI